MGSTVFTCFALSTLAVLGVHDASASGPPRNNSWWRGLEAAEEHTSARGVVAVKPSIAGRVRILGAQFRMGSSPVDLVRAIILCKREVFSNECERPEVAALFHAEWHAHSVTLSTYELDRVEVTVAAYARCAEAGPCAPAEYPRGDARFDRPDFPVTFVRWDDATTYCGWAGGRLPTEAEWEYAARGPQLRDFPWGSVYNPHLANHGAFAQDETDATDGFVGLAPVGSFPDGATPLGILDMSGNASEWVSDFYDVEPDEGTGYPAKAQVNPKGAPNGMGHAIRGGSYAEGAAWMRGAARGTMLMPRSGSVGFRCAYDVR